MPFITPEIQEIHDSIGYIDATDGCVRDLFSRHTRAWLEMERSMRQHPFIGSMQEDNGQPIAEREEMEERLRFGGQRLRSRSAKRYSSPIIGPLRALFCHPPARRYGRATADAACWDLVLSGGMRYEKRWLPTLENIVMALLFNVPCSSHAARSLPFPMPHDVNEIYPNQIKTVNHFGTISKDHPLLSLETQSELRRQFYEIRALFPSRRNVPLNFTPSLAIQIIHFFNYFMMCIAAIYGFQFASLGAETPLHIECASNSWCIGEHWAVSYDFKNDFGKRYLQTILNQGEDFIRIPFPWSHIGGAQFWGQYRQTTLLPIARIPRDVFTRWNELEV